MEDPCREFRPIARLFHRSKMRQSQEGKRIAHCAEIIQTVLLKLTIDMSYSIWHRI